MFILKKNGSTIFKVHEVLQIRHCEFIVIIDRICVILQRPECNFLVHLDNSQFKAFKSIVIDMVCACVVQHCMIIRVIYGPKIGHYVIVKALQRVLYVKYSTRGVVERSIQQEAKLSAMLVWRPHPKCYISCVARAYKVH